MYTLRHTSRISIKQFREVSFNKIVIGKSQKLDPCVKIEGSFEEKMFFRFLRIHQLLRKQFE